MEQQSGGGRQPLAERTEEFARRVRAFVRLLPKTVSNREDVPQLLRASGSVGANYIEVNESLGPKDFLMHARICRKEAKESGYWLRLLNTHGRADLDAERDALVREATELVRMFSRMIQNRQ